MKANPAAWILLPLLLGSGCSRGSDDTQTGATKRKIPQDEQTAELARHHNCFLLSEEVRKLAGTNEIFSFVIQTALNSNKRLAANASLNDVVQSGERVEAIFELDTWTLWPRKCIAKLECPTNLTSALSKRGEEFCIVFEARENHNVLNFGIRANEDLEEVVSLSVVTIEGRLIAIAESGESLRASTHRLK
jgi:hypothetical protein